MKISNLKLDWESKKILIVGAGLTGMSCANFLRQYEIDFMIVDSRYDRLNTHQDIDIIFGEFEEKYFSAADILIVSPGISIKHPYIQKAMMQGKEVIGDVEIFCRLSEKPIIAITGSNGKSTVTTLLGDILRAANLKTKIGGNIGVPCLDLLADDSATDCYVLELSSFQLETTFNLKAYASIILNLTEDHLDRYNSFLDYCNAKKKILLNAENIIVNKDDKKVVEFCSEFNANKISFSLTNQTADFYLERSETENTEYVCHNKKEKIDISNTKLVGQHNKQNILAALSLSSVFDINLKNTANVINNFLGLPHRSQLVSNYKGVHWINDSKATNIGATSAALNGFEDRKLHLILGGQGKGQDFKELIPAIKSNVIQIIIFGEDADLIHTAIKDKLRTNINVVQTLDESVKHIAQSLSTGDIVLFSPACASFDQFDNYMQRGDAFIDVVKGLES